ncbi:MAG: hypothetical protein E3J66_00165 [Dehalococcoidia bacterium]|nr:MAG: hypothetical protein E3J66_00165 [Dehalococcoidia bacterium]
MKTEAVFCDLCATAGLPRLAKGFYITDENDSWDACATHLKEVEKYGFDTHEFETLGDIDEVLIRE